MNYLETQFVQFERLTEVISSTGRSKTSLWQDQQKGLFPTPIKLGGETSRAAHYLKHEIQAVLIARAAEQTDDEVKALVSKMKDQRKELLSDLLSQIDNIAA